MLYQVSHPYKTSDKITVVYILIFVLLNNKWEDNQMIAHIVHI